jgi:hypothetical protein
MEGGHRGLPQIAQHHRRPQGAQSSIARLRTDLRPRTDVRAVPADTTRSSGTADISDKVQRVAFITMLSLLWPLVLTVIADALYDDIVPPTIKIILLVVCAISFGVAYFDQVFLEGDN